MLGRAVVASKERMGTDKAEPSFIHAPVAAGISKDCRHFSNGIVGFAHAPGLAIGRATGSLARTAESSTTNVAVSVATITGPITTKAITERAC